MQTALGIDSTPEAPSKVSSAAGQGSGQSKKVSSPAGKTAPQARPKGVAAAALPPTGEPVRLEQQPPARLTAAMSQKPFAASGDDYLDDFEELVEQTEAEQPAKARLQKPVNVKRAKIVRL